MIFKASSNQNHSVILLYCRATSPVLTSFTSPLTTGIKLSVFLVEFSFTTVHRNFFEACSLLTLYTHAIIFYVLWVWKIYSHFLYDSLFIFKSVSGTFIPAALSLLFKLLIHFLSHSQCFAWFYPMDEQFSIFFWLQFPLHNYKFFLAFQGCNLIGHHFNEFQLLVERVPPLDCSSREDPVLVSVWWSWTPLSSFCFPLPSSYQNNRHIT